MLTTITIFLLDMRQLAEQFMDGTSTTPVLVDPISDAHFGNGQYALTWRSYGQDLPIGAKDLWTYRTDQQVTSVYGRVIDPLIHLFPSMDDVETIEVVMQLFEKIEHERTTTATGQYQHSVEYFDLVHQLQFAQSNPFERFAISEEPVIERSLRLL